MELAALPRLASGKLDRSGLPAPDWRGRDAAPPQGATETALAGLWTALLGVERVGRTDGFFERGGHSLLAAKLVARIRAEFGRDLPLRAVFEAPGLAALAARIEAAPAVAAETNMAVPRAPRDRAVPATDMQAGLWHWQRRHPDSSAWTIFGALRLSGPLDTDALRASFDHIVARHEALRTTFRAGAAGLELVVHPSAPIRIERLDLTDRPRSDIETAALGFAQNQAERPFDMAVDLPIRVGLVRLGRQDHVLTLAVHHAAGDGRSMALLLDELGAGYRAFAGGSEPGLPEPARQATDYAAWRRAQDRTPAAEARLAETLERLSGPWRPDPVPTDRPRRPDLGTRGARIRFEIPGAAVLRLAANARALNATLPMAAMAALGIALRRRSDRDAMSLGILVTDRGPSELETVMGCLVATDLAVLEIDPAQSFARILAAVRDERLAAQAAGPVPYARLLDALARRDCLSHAAAPFQVLFSYLRVEPESADLLAGLRARDFPVADTDESFELEFDFKERADGGSPSPSATSPTCSTPRPSRRWRRTFPVCWRPPPATRIAPPHGSGHPRPCPMKRPDRPKTLTGGAGRPGQHNGTSGMRMTHKEKDLIGIGFGPANLALAVALAEMPGAKRLDWGFVERQDGFHWHRDMQIEGSTVQISFLKDLATLRDPTSPFTFVNYLHHKGRLESFINLKQDAPTREEFTDYFRWAAAAFTDRVNYGETVEAVEPVARNGTVSRLRVLTRDASGARFERLTRDLVVAVGGRPRIPALFEGLGEDRIIHTSSYLSRRDDRIAGRGPCGWP